MKSEYPHIHPNNAPLIYKWITERGGIALWKSADLSDPGATCYTPADKPKPHWKYYNTPEIITDPELLIVDAGTLYKTIPVTLRIGRNGLKITITDASQRKVDKALDAAGNGAWYEKGTLTDPEILIYQPDPNPPTLAQWMQTRQHLLDEQVTP